MTTLLYQLLVNHWLLVFLVFITPYEDFILKFLPGPDIVFLASRFITELLIYAAFTILVFKKVGLRRSFNVSPLDLPIALFLISFFISVVVNPGSAGGSILSFRSNIRYIILFYLIINMSITNKQVHAIIKSFWLAGILQIGVGLLQFFSGGALNYLLLPRQTEGLLISKAYVLLATGRESGSLYGTTGDTIFLAYLMLVLLFFLLAYIGLQKASVKQAATGIHSPSGVIWILIACCTCISALTFSRFCFLISLGLILLHLMGFAHSKVKALGLLSILGGLFLVLFVILLSIQPPEFVTGRDLKSEFNFHGNLTSVFTEEYISVLQRQRLGALAGIGPTVILHKPLFGYGPSTELTIQGINRDGQDFLTKEWTSQGFEDVYWIAILSYQGLLGLLLFASIFIQLYLAASRIHSLTQNPTTKYLSLIAMYSVIAIIPSLFISGSIEFRIFGLYFWMIPGLMVNLYQQEKRGYLDKDGPTLSQPLTP